MYCLSDFLWRLSIYYTPVAYFNTAFQKPVNTGLFQVSIFLVIRWITLMLNKTTFDCVNAEIIYNQMRFKNIKLTGIILTGIFLVLALLVLYLLVPRNYHTAKMKPRARLQYWNLSTGSKIGYTLVGAKGEKKTPVVFLQGGPGGSITERTVNSLAPLSESGHDLYFYDQVGSGHSNRLANISEYTVERHLSDLAEIITKTGSPEVILIGQSWGAILAVLFTAKHPEIVEKLVLTSPGPLLPVRIELAGIKAPDSLCLVRPAWSNRQASEKCLTFRIRVISLWATLFGSKLVPDEEMDDFQTYYNNELNKSVVCDTVNAPRAEGGDGFYAQLMTVKSFSAVEDPRPALININTPLLVMKGQCDSQKWGFTKEYLDIFHDHRLVVIPGAGHSISVEQPGLYLEKIRDFLDN